MVVHESMRPVSPGIRTGDPPAPPIHRSPRSSARTNTTRWSWTPATAWGTHEASRLSGPTLMHFGHAAERIYLCGVYVKTIYIYVDGIYI